MKILCRTYACILSEQYENLIPHELVLSCRCRSHSEEEKEESNLINLNR